MCENLAVDSVTIKLHQLRFITDYGSRYRELLGLVSSTSIAGVTNKLMEEFAKFGFPASLVFNNGPQFTSAEIKYVKSIPQYLELS